MTSKKIMIPAFAAVFALMFAAATPYVLAQPGDEFVAYGDYAKKKHRHSVLVEGFVGSIEITQDSDRASLLEQVTVSLSEAADGLDVVKAKLGVAINENDDKYLVWLLKEVDRDFESDSKTITIHVVDAADADNTVSVIKEFDSMQDKRHGFGSSPTQFNELRPNLITGNSI